MKKFNVFVLLVIVVVVSSCQVLGIEVHNYEYANRKIKYLFKETEYPMIDNEDIISIDTISTNQWGGSYVNVTFKYGTGTDTWRFYIDKDGKKVKTKELKKHNGFYRADSWLYTITDKGRVRFHYSFVIVIVVIIYFEYKRFTQ